MYYEKAAAEVRAVLRNRYEAQKPRLVVLNEHHDEPA
jgi:hypothetical protein